MHKKDALDAEQAVLNFMGKPRLINSGFSAWSVTGLLSGEQNALGIYASGVGSGFGLPRATLLDASDISPVTVQPSYSVLRTTGLSRLLRNKLITPRSTTWSMMLPISTRTDVY
jgi:hypothetical protein